MFLIECPFCGEAREEQEFRCMGEAYIQRPPLGCCDAEWGDYLFNRTNPKGRVVEQWAHTAGCRKLFVVDRNNVTNEIYAVHTFASYREQAA